MKLTDKIHILRINFEINISSNKKIPRFVNVLIIFGKKITLIDTGVHGSENIIFNYIKEQGRNINDIDCIILSHSHPDHIGSAAKIKEITNCRIVAHKLEQNWIEDIELQNKERPVPGFFELVRNPVKIDSLICDNYDEIKIEDSITLKIYKASGHSKGSLNILFEEDKILFTADSIPLKYDIPNYEDFYELMDSLKKIRNRYKYNILLTSWTAALFEKSEIEKIIRDGEEYMLKINHLVKKHYITNNDVSHCCKLVIDDLGLPSHFVIPIVDKAFRSHLKSIS